MCEDLIRQAQQGDRHAFEAVLTKHYDTLYRFAYKWCGHQADAQDIAQLACLKLANGIGQFRFQASFTSWLYRLVINCAKDWQRSQSRHLHEELPMDVELKGSLDHPILLGQLLTQLERLGEGMKEALLLVHIEGLTHKEAAEVLEVKESTVSWRLHEIRKHLKPWFEELL